MKLDHVAAQLYTVREHLKSAGDIGTSLGSIAKIGYRAVELATLGPIEPKELRSMLDGEGLTACSSHENGEELLKAPERVAERLHAVGCAIAAYPYPRDIALGSLDEVKQFAGRLNRSGELLQKAGITLAYHNHDIEFRRFADRTILETLFAETDRRFLAAEIDVYWVQAGGADPVAWCERMKGRLPVLHMKDYGVSADRRAMFQEIGTGNLDFPRIVKAAEKSGCTWFVVEQDGNWMNNDPFASLAKSFEYIKAHLAR